MTQQPLISHHHHAQSCYVYLPKFVLRILFCCNQCYIVILWPSVWILVENVTEQPDLYLWLFNRSFEFLSVHPVRCNENNNAKLKIQPDRRTSANLIYCHIVPVRQKNYQKLESKIGRTATSPQDFLNDVTNNYIETSKITSSLLENETFSIRTSFVSKYWSQQMLIRETVNK